MSTPRNARPLDELDDSVSVIIPAFNRAHTIKRSVDSVLGQSHKSLEVIVVDDCSSDDTVSVVEALMATDERVSLAHQPRNLGAQAARNRGLERARGAWIAFLDSDDLYLADSLRSRLDVARRTGATIVHSECVVWHPDGSERPFGTPGVTGAATRELLESPGPTFPGIMATRGSFAKIGGLDASIRSFQEWDTAIRLSMVGTFAFVATPTFVWDQTGSDTISSDLGRSAAGYEQVVRKHAKLILRAGGPRLMAKHMLEAARWYADAGLTVRAGTRLLAAGVLWPFAARPVGRMARRLVHEAFAQD